MNYIQREFERVPLHVPAILEMSGQVIENAKSCNISMGGMCISLDQVIKNVQDCIVSFRTKHRGQIIPFKAKGHIVWQRNSIDPKDESFHAGLKFLELDQENKNNLAQIIIHQLMEQHDQKTIEDGA